MHVERGSILRILIVASMVGATLLTLAGRGDGAGGTQVEAAPLAQNGNDGNDNDGNGNDGNGNDGNGNDGNGNGDGNGDAGQAPAAAQAPPPPPPPTCAFAGRETILSSPDGRITIRVFPTMTRNIRIAARLPVDPATVPPPPGSPVGGLLFELQAEICEGGALGELPAEVNLGIRYSDQEAAGMGEQGFTISMLDPADRQWRPVEKQAADPPNNWVSATITRMGFYVVHPR
jgi:hypothetical protein